MVTPAFSQAWMSADPASMDTFFPSIVSSTSARRLAVVEKDLGALVPAVALDLAAARSS